MFFYCLHVYKQCERNSSTLPHSKFVPVEVVDTRDSSRLCVMLEMLDGQILQIVDARIIVLE